MHQNNSIYTFTYLSRFKSLFHAVTTKQLPSVRTGKLINTRNISTILERLGIPESAFYLMNQIHRGNITTVSPTDNKKLENTDGMIIRKKGLYGGIMTADCLPIIFYDPVQNNLALIHAGYKGLLSNIVSNAVLSLVKLGSKTSDIFVGIGPGIARCCYTVPLDRVHQFKQILPKYDNFYTIVDGQAYLDLQQVASLLLTEAGIENNNIEIAPYCTKTNNDMFFSYRAEGENFGEFLTIGGLL